MPTCNHLIRRLHRGGVIGGMILAGLGALACSFCALVTGPFALWSGLPKLVERYPVDHIPAGPSFRWRTVQVGPVFWRRCVTVIIGPEGFYFRVRAPLGSYPPVLIPWSDLAAPQETGPWWYRRVRLEVGHPKLTTIGVSPDLYALMRPYIGE